MFRPVRKEGQAIEHMAQVEQEDDSRRIDEARPLRDHGNDQELGGTGELDQRNDHGPEPPETSLRRGQAKGATNGEVADHDGQRDRHSLAQGWEHGSLSSRLRVSGQERAPGFFTEGGLRVKTGRLGILQAC